MAFCIGFFILFSFLFYFGKAGCVFLWLRDMGRVFVLDHLEVVAVFWEGLRLFYFHYY